MLAKTELNNALFAPNALATNSADVLLHHLIDIFNPIKQSDLRTILFNGIDSALSCLLIE